jgi:hypothetical protein
MLGPAFWRVDDEPKGSIYFLLKALPEMFAALRIPIHRLNVFLRGSRVED